MIFKFCLSIAAQSEGKGSSSQRLVSSLSSLYLISKIKPQLLVKHAMTLQPYLSTKCSVSVNNHNVLKFRKVNASSSPFWIFWEFNPLTSSFSEKNNKHILRRFLTFSDHLCANFVSNYWKGHLHHEKVPGLAFHQYHVFTTFLLRHAHKLKFLSAVVGLLPGLLSVKKYPRKRHQDGTFLQWSHWG